ncbi:hypothetical protein MMC30_001643 [Trapelia coarctata]|nr:hypothetical protein [Trapelia coarctata]
MPHNDDNELTITRSRATNGSANPEEAQSLLADSDLNPQSDELDNAPPTTANGSASPPTPRRYLPSHRRLPQPLRASSLVHPTEPGTPRTPRTANRVRWASEERPRRPNSRGGMGFYPNSEGATTWERDGVADWATFDEESFGRRQAERAGEEDEYSDDAFPRTEEESGGGRGRRGSTAQRTPLLTDIEAPSITEALREEEVDIGVGEGGRPKSGMRSAFMNMANSIMYDWCFCFISEVEMSDN